MVLHDCDINTILAETLKYRAESEILRALKDLYKHVTERFIQTLLQILDNKCSASMKIFICSVGSHKQLVPTGLHCSLIAEQ